MVEVVEKRDDRLGGDDEDKGGDNWKIKKSKDWLVDSMEEDGEDLGVQDDS